MKLTEVKNKNGDRYFCTKHKSGLKIFIYPQKGFTSTYALLGTKYGSINNKFAFSKDEEIINVPDGTAHFLEHKMFESKEGDAFEFYAKTGASANAYTSFDKTCYLFSCTENFNESLKTLIKFVFTPYFTEETIQKEQGIIGQEIKMYEDSAEWTVFLNLLKGMYHNHPINIDIAGSVDTIATLTPKMLYDCYNAFYNPANMALCIAGKVDIEKTIELMDKILPDIPSHAPIKIFPDEPYNVKTHLIEARFPIANPLFQLGFKESVTCELTAKDLALADILTEIISAKSSPMYRELLDKRLINTSSFETEYFYGDHYASFIFSGESSDPYKVTQIIKDEITKLQKSGISKEAFERAKKSSYAKNISILNSADNIANIMMSLYFSNMELFETIDSIVETTFEEINEYFNKKFDTENYTLSVTLPLEE